MTQCNFEISLDVVRGRTPKGGPVWSATSAEVPGFVLENKSLDSLLDEAPEVAQLLLKLNQGLDVAVKVSSMKITYSMGGDDVDGI